MIPLSEIQQKLNVSDSLRQRILLYEIFKAPVDLNQSIHLGIVDHPSPLAQLVLTNVVQNSTNSYFLDYMKWRLAIFFVIIIGTLLGSVFGELPWWAFAVVLVIGHFLFTRAIEAAKRESAIRIASESIASFEELWHCGALVIADRQSKKWWASFNGRNDWTDVVLSLLGFTELTGRAPSTREELIDEALAPIEDMRRKTRTSSIVD